MIANMIAWEKQIRPVINQAKEGDLTAITLLKLALHSLYEDNFDLYAEVIDILIEQGYAI